MLTPAGPTRSPRTTRAIHSRTRWTTMLSDSPFATPKMVVLARVPRAPRRWTPLRFRRCGTSARWWSGRSARHRAGRERGRDRRRGDGRWPRRLRAVRRQHQASSRRTPQREVQPRTRVEARRPRVHGVRQRRFTTSAARRQSWSFRHARCRSALDSEVRTQVPSNRRSSESTYGESRPTADEACEPVTARRARATRDAKLGH